MPVLQFRDGARDVAPYLADLLRRVEIYKLTYSEAVAEVNRELENEVVRKRMARVISDHFRGR